MANERTNNAKPSGPRQNPNPPGQSDYRQNVVVLNDFSGVTFERRDRTRIRTGATTTRYTLSIEAEPLLNIFDGVPLGRGPAEAIREILEEQLLTLRQRASETTILKRKQAINALAAGKTWAVLRYTGGRTGESKPGTGDTFGNDSGRLARGVHLMQNTVEQSFTINVPANRLDPTTWGGSRASFDSFVQRLVNLVPALQNPKGILGDERFVRAVANSEPVVLAKDAYAKWRAYGKVAREAVKLGRLFVG